MEIRTNTWHYKLWASMQTGSKDQQATLPAPNLCTYFWNVVGGCFLIIAGTTCVIVGVPALAFCLGAMLWISGKALLAWFASPDAGQALLWTGEKALIVMAAIVLFYLVGALIYGTVSFVRESETVKLVRAYLKAKKDKICPLITFVAPA